MDIESAIWSWKPIESTSARYPVKNREDPGFRQADGTPQMAAEGGEHDED